MNGLPPEFLKPLRSLLVQMDQFKDATELPALFATDARLALWRERLPDLSGVHMAGRVNRLIDYLLPLKNHKDQSGLVLFLQVLSEELSPQDAHQQQLESLAKKIENWCKLATDEPITTPSESSSSPSISLQITILQFLLDHFDGEELRELCFNLKVVYDDLRGENRKTKAQELINYLNRRERLPELISEMKKQRPNIRWPGDSEIPITKQPEPAVAEQIIVFDHFNVILRMQSTTWKLKVQNKGQKKLKRILLSLHPPATLWLNPSRLSIGDLNESTASKEFLLSVSSRPSNTIDGLEIAATYLVDGLGTIRSRQNCQFFI